MDRELLKELVGAIMNTSVAMLTIAQQLHNEFGHEQVAHLADCSLCAQYTERDRKNYELCKRVLEEN